MYNKLKEKIKQFKINAIPMSIENCFKAQEILDNEIYEAYQRNDITESECEELIDSLEED